MNTDSQAGIERSGMLLVPPSISRARRLIPAAIILCCCALTLFGSRTSAVVNPPADYFAASSMLDPDYSKFSHSTPKEHAELMGRGNCASCHRRSGASVDLKFPLHKDCTGCHLLQFTASNSSAVNPICTICHRPESLNSPNAPLKSFPRLVSFRAEFDHAEHLRGIDSARPAKGCAACHTSVKGGVAETVPARSSAHQICYECHSSGKSASKFSSCGSCHTFGHYSPTAIAARSYRMGFSHADHGPRERLNCDRCHNVRERGLPQTKQVSSILSAQHYPNARAQSCASCHNDQRVFGDSKANFDICKRCHKGTKFGG